MDRNNSLESKQIDPSVVALRKESVDRNDFPVVPVELTTLSLSARRAWIEISASHFKPYSVRESLSARRAWIEINVELHDWPPVRSLSARRAWIEIAFQAAQLVEADSRSPQGERG